MNLTEKRCVPCEGGVPPIKGEDINEYLSQLKNPWEVKDEKKISRAFAFSDFKETMQFVNKVADIAEEENHHPDLYVSYGKTTIELSTHAIGGLSENDFILAAKIDEINNKQ